MSQFALIFSTISSDSDMVARRRSWGDDFIYVVPAGKFSPYTPVAHHLVNEDGLVEYLPYIARFNAINKSVSPWTPSNEDLFALDWTFATFDKEKAATLKGNNIIKGESSK